MKNLISIIIDLPISLGYITTMKLKSIILCLSLLSSPLALSKEGKEIKLPKFSEEVMNQGEVKMKSSEKCVITSDSNFGNDSVSCSTNKNLDTSTKARGYTGETSSFMNSEQQKYRRNGNR